MKYMTTKEIVDQLKREAKARIGDVEFSNLLSTAASRIENLNRDNLELEKRTTKKFY